MKTKIAILGAGSFGTALAVLISGYDNCDVMLWSAICSEIEDIKKNKENTKLLPGIVID
ncbi:MAG: glycerol-3-phosphate dehydrogenase, partial [Oscillospiraceae bacterium]|nr:glycerol-3-phosphate dehydrogenase [Oscillospiraceae bacterium]